MNYFKTKEVFFLFLLVLFFSCSRDSDEQNVTSPSVDSFEILQSGFSQKAVFSFQYDNLNRVTKFTGYSYNPPSLTVLPGDTIFIMEFEYATSGQLPTRIIQRATWPGNVYTRIHNLLYNTTNIPVRDSTVVTSGNSNVTSVFYYRYNSNAIISEIYHNGNTFPDKDSFVIVNDNIVSVDRKIPGGASQRIEYDFDNSLNPLKGTNIAPIFFALTDKRTPENEFFSIWTLCSKNNIKTIRIFYNGSLGNTYNLSYVAGTNGYPERRYWHHTNPSYIVDTLFYKY